jgi:Na+/H+ antiporter NhaD/arsenite permease-like protein
MTPVVIIVLGALVVLLPVLFPGAFTVDDERIADVMSLDEREAIHNHRLLIQCGIVLAAVFVGFVAHKQIHMEPSLVAMTGAGILIVISGLSRDFYLSAVEWETLLFFAGLFVMVGTLVKIGVIDKLAHAASHAIGGSPWVTTMLILGVSFMFSGFVNNVPYAATMTPIVGQFASSMHDFNSQGVLWWALIMGTVMGGNLTAVGASANVVVMGIAQRSGNPVSFGAFTRKGAVVTAVSFVISVGYLWLRYFAFT